jgi:hypothetical protein
MMKKIMNNTRNPLRAECKGKDGKLVDVTWMIEGDNDTSPTGVITGDAHIREVDDAIYKELMTQPAFAALIDTRQLIVVGA